MEQRLTVKRSLFLVPDLPVQKWARNPNPARNRHAASSSKTQRTDYKTLAPSFKQYPQTCHNTNHAQSQLANSDRSPNHSQVDAIMGFRAHKVSVKLNGAHNPVECSYVQGKWADRVL